MAKLPEPKTKLEPGFKPKMKPPTAVPALARWPPEGHRGAHRVKLGQNWGMLKSHWLVDDVWDLIYFNFRTMDPKEVNTYLRHYVGCWKSAPDGKNFSFTDKDDPGYVYIPPRGWKRGDPLPFHAEALSLLEKALPKYPYVVLGDHHVSRTDLYHVVMLIREGRIGVVHDPSLTANAEWRSGNNLLAIRSSALGTWTSRVTLVHEATHAINDYKRADIYGWQDEFLARIASAMWGRATDEGMANAAADAPYMGPIANAAFVLSRYMQAIPRRMKRVSDLDTFLPDYRDATKLLNPVLDLRREIMHSVEYMKFGWWKRYRYGGIP